MEALSVYSQDTGRRTEGESDSPWHGAKYSPWQEVMPLSLGNQIPYVLLQVKCITENPLMYSLYRTQRCGCAVERAIFHKLITLGEILRYSGNERYQCLISACKHVDQPKQ